MGFRMGGPSGSISLAPKANSANMVDERFLSSYSASFKVSPGATQRRLAEAPTLMPGAQRTIAPPSRGGVSAMSASMSAASLLAKAVEGGGGGVAAAVPFPDEGARAVSAQGKLRQDVPTLNALSREMAQYKAKQGPQTEKPMTKHTKRRIYELLASPELADHARSIFSSSDRRKAGTLDLNDVVSVLQQLHANLQLPKPSQKVAEQLFKKHDVNGDATLQFPEFFELFLAQLRRAAFDRSSVVSRLNREFFVNKARGKVWDKFERLKELGAGTFGTAYLAKRKSTQEQRVVKAVHKSKVRLPLDDIEQEILIMRQVDHPHVLRLFEWYEDPGQIYLVLEVLEGGTLKDVVLKLQKQQKGLREAWVRKVMAPVIDGMAYCHSLRLIHKDLKDENIMLLQKDPNFDEPFPVIIDLGIAEMFSESTDRGAMMGGTPLTMAPEVWKDNFGPKCDVWSLGCVLFELLAGTYPFMAMSMSPNSWLRLHQKGPDWTKLRTASKEACALCKLMLTFREEDRPTMRKLTQHPYFDIPDHELKDLPPEQFNQLLSFSKEQDVKRSLLLQIASRLPVNRSGEIIHMFENLDTDNSGSLSLPEVQHFFESVGITEPEIVAQTFHLLDADGDKALSFTEFASGMLLVFKDMLEQRLHTLFMRYDLDGSGELDPPEAKAFLEDVFAAMDGSSVGKSEAILGELMRAGGDSNGKLTYQKVRAYMLQPQGMSSPQSTARSSLSSSRAAR